MHGNVVYPTREENGIPRVLGGQEPATCNQPSTTLRKENKGKVPCLGGVGCVFGLGRRTLDSG